MGPSPTEFTKFHIPSANVILTDGGPPICLRIGERHFIVHLDTLIRQSTYFAAFYAHGSEAYDGALFVDSDPDIFGHIINFLRTGIYPLFFDSNTQTFDHVEYFYLLTESKRFGVQKLIDWITDKKYLNAVKVTKSVTILDDITSGFLQDYLNQRAPSDDKVDVSTTWAAKKVYLCPRGIEVHRGDRSRCGRVCEAVRRQRGGRVEFEETSMLSAIITTTKISIDPQYCLDGP
ncbi:hypothetical protein F5Y04DRAFT_276800 [Hypomontagnella monticulosa]|nr:hypothetical protein F5Y04DRAFT_276800 [Hypomontagnella monticulosa]